MKKIAIQLLLVLFLNSNSFSQDLDIEVEKELEITDDNGPYPVLINLGEKGLLWLVQEKTKNYELNGEMSAVVYDKNLKKSQKVSYTLEGKNMDGYSQTSYLKESGKLFIFINRPKQQDDIVCFDIDKMKFQSFKVDLEAGMMWGKQPAFNVVNIDSKPHMLIFENKNIYLAEIDLKNGALINKSFPDFFKDKKIERIEKIDEKSSLIEYNTSSTTHNFAIVNNDLQVLVEEVLTPTDKTGIFNLGTHSFSISEEGFFISGTFTNTKDIGYSGVFLAKIVGNKQVFYKQYSYTDFKHFFDFSGNKEKLKSKAEKGKYFFAGNVSSFEPFISEANLIVSLNYIGTEDPATILFLETDMENGNLIKDRSVKVEGCQKIDMSLDSFGNANYYSIAGAIVKCTVYSEGKVEQGDDFNSAKLLDKNETFGVFGFAGSMEKWYGDYYYTIFFKTGDKLGFNLKKIKVVLE